MRRSETGTFCGEQSAFLKNVVLKSADYELTSLIAELAEQNDQCKLRCLVEAKMKKFVPIAEHYTRPAMLTPAPPAALPRCEN